MHYNITITGSIIYMHTPFRYSNQTVRRIDRSRDRGMLRSD